MHKCFHILPVSLISFLLMGLTGCAHFSKEVGILEKRAGYSSKEKTKAEVRVSRIRGQVKKAWLHAHEMPTGDYFAGAWVYLLIEETKWSLPEKNH